MSSIHGLAGDLIEISCFSCAMRRPYEDIGNRLRAAREALGITQAEVCRTLGIKANRLSQYESGERQITIIVARKMRRTYGISLDYIYDGDMSGLSGKLLRVIQAA